MSYPEAAHTSWSRCGAYNAFCWIYPQTPHSSQRDTPHQFSNCTPWQDLLSWKSPVCNSLLSCSCSGIQHLNFWDCTLLFIQKCRRCSSKLFNIEFPWNPQSSDEAILISFCSEDYFQVYTRTEGLSLEPI